MSEVKIRKVKLPDGKVGYTDQNGNPLIRRVRKDGSCVFFDSQNNRVAEYPAGTVQLKSQQVPQEQGVAIQQTAKPETKPEVDENPKASVVQKMGKVPNQKPVIQPKQKTSMEEPVQPRSVAQKQKPTRNVKPDGDKISRQNLEQQVPSNVQEVSTENSSNNEQNIAKKAYSRKKEEKTIERQLREQAKDAEEYKQLLKKKDQERFERARKELKTFDSKKKHKGEGFNIKAYKKHFIIGGVAVLIILTLVVAKKFIGGKKITPYDITSAILLNEKGQYTYTFNVGTSAIGDTVVTLADKTAEEELSDAEKMFNESMNASEDSESQEEQTEAVQETESTGGVELVEGKTDEWDLFSTKSDWTYPVYTVTFDGVTNSIDPLEAKCHVSVATNNTSNTDFTEVIVKDNSVYVNIGMLREWLRLSNDRYLESLVTKLPDSTSFAVVDEKAMQIFSRYAEDGEKVNSGYISPRQIYLEKASELNAFVKAIGNALGKTGLSSDEEKASVILDEEGSQKAFGAVKAYNSGYLTTYGNIYNKFHQDGLINDDFLTQAVKEQDNRLTARQDVTNYFLTHKVADMNPQVQLSATKVNIEGKAVLTSQLNMDFTANDTNYSITADLKRVGAAGEVAAPEGECRKMEDIGGIQVFADVVYDVIDYFNITGVKSALQLELSPENILDDMLADFADMVNGLHVYPTYLTRANIGDYIKEFKGKNPEKAQSEAELNNIKVVASIMDTLESYGFSGVAVADDEVGYLDKVERYPTTKYNIDGVDLAIKVNTNESNGKLVVLDAVFSNTANAEPTEEAEATEEGEATEEEPNISIDSEYTEVGKMESASEAQAYILKANKGILDIENEDDVKLIDKLYECAKTKGGSSEYLKIYKEMKPECLNDSRILGEVSDDIDNLSNAIDDTVAKDDTIEDIVESASKATYIDISAFHLGTIEGSIYAVNDGIKVQEFDNTFDLDTLVKEIYVEPGQTVAVKMYVITDNDDGHMDIYYNNTNIGVAVEY